MAKSPEKPLEKREKPPFPETEKGIEGKERLPETKRGLLEFGKNIINKVTETAKNVIKSAKEIIGGEKNLIREIDEVQKEIKNLSTETQRKIIKEMMAKGLFGKEDKEALPILNDLAKSKNPLVRETVVEHLPQFGTEGLDLLKKMSKDGYENVLLAVAQHASEFGKDGLDVLRDLAGSKLPSIQKAVLEQLPKFAKGEKESTIVLQILEQIARKGFLEIKELAVQQLSKFHNEGVEDSKWVFKSLAKSENPLLRKAVAQHAPEFDKEGMEVLKKLLYDDELFVQDTAIEQLSKFGKEGALCLEDLLNSLDWLEKNSKITKRRKEEVQIRVARHASKFGEDGLLILEALAKREIPPFIQQRVDEVKKEIMSGIQDKKR